MGMWSLERKEWPELNSSATSSTWVGRTVIGWRRSGTVMAALPSVICTEDADKHRRPAWRLHDHCVQICSQISWRFLVQYEQSMVRASISTSQCRVFESEFLFCFPKGSL